MDTEFILAEIDAEIARLQSAKVILTQALTDSAAPIPASKPTKRRRLGKVARKRIAGAQHKRWALAKKTAKTSPVKVAKKVAAPARKRASRRLSAEAKRRIADAQRKRWAAIKATKKAVKAAPAKNVAKKAPVVKAEKAAPEKAAPAPTEAAQS